MYGGSKLSRFLRAGALSLAATSLLSYADIASGRDDQNKLFGGVWQVRVTPDTAASEDGKQEFVDLVLFEENKMTASACAVYGFAPADFAINGTAFSCTMTSEQGTIVWSGAMRVGRMMGSVDWSRPDGSISHYTLDGERYTPPADESGSTGD